MHSKGNLYPILVEIAAYLENSGTYLVHHILTIATTFDLRCESVTYKPCIPLYRDITKRIHLSVHSYVSH